MRGHVRKRGNTWTLVYDLPRDPITGKRRKRWKGGYRIRRDAEAALADIINPLERGTHVEPTKQTVREYLLDTWLPAAEIRLRPSTRLGYRIVIEKQRVPKIGGIRLQSLMPGRLNVMYSDLLANGRQDGRGGLSNRSVRICHTVLRKALADAKRWGILTRNVADSAAPPRPGLAKNDAARKQKTWTAEQLKQFLTHVRAERIYPAFLLAATTGMRRGEVLGLRWCDLDLDAGRVSITQTLIAPGYKLQFSAPKTESGHRAVTLDTATVRALREHRGAVEEERRALGLAWDEAWLVFPNADSSPIIPHLFTLAFQTLARKAGLPVIRFHDLRHTHATLALQAGVHPKIVSERLGHSSIAITLDTYSHVIPTLQETAAELVALMVVPDHEEPSADLLVPETPWNLTGPS